MEFLNESSGRQSDTGLSGYEKIMLSTLGLAIPLLAIGPVAMAAALAIGFIMLLILFSKNGGWGQLLSDIRTPLGGAIGFTLVWWLISSIFSFDPGQSLVAMARVSLYLFFAYALYFELRGHSLRILWTFRWMIGATMVMIIYINWVAYLDEDALSVIELIRGKELSFKLAFKKFFSVTSCLIPVFLWFGYKMKGLQRYLVWLLVPLGLAVMWYNGEEVSRSAFGGLIGGLLAVFMVIGLSKISAKLRYISVIGLIVATFIGVIGFLESLPRQPFDGMTVQQTAGPFPDVHRQIIWGFVYDRILDNPLLGVGLDTVNMLPESKEKFDVMIGKYHRQLEYVPSHPHNWVLEIASESGLPGLLGVLAVLGIFTANLVTRVSDSMSGVSVIVGLTGVFWVSSLGNFSFWSSWWQLIFMLLVGLLYAALPYKSKIHEE